ncbi:glycine betaine/proline transport system substrate-binding protein [Salinihabitans flavidus]|uniref:Glycine betaine/proline transport system substrate-binding protein n=1 Tax=Salinihabitans flavidus TaxID=569882 RepID=A0A1H8W5E2_9RHOB|nr:ABC transporter substrate-binding protein [Salinihabitans flavidus]SEP22819.1 glycine betaine/proline transport system substrate-binding protein [Salinihabitans flavidus]
MKKLSLILAAGAMAAPIAAHAQSDECGDVSITEMNWASAQVVTSVATFIMEQGYGCDVSVVQSDTVPAVTSVAENGEPDIVTELWLNSTGDAYTKLKEDGKVVEAGPVLDPGGVEGWWIPTYLAEEHPELKTIDGILENPELVGARFYNCPEGWGCRVVSDNLSRALDLEGHGIEVFNAGSGQVLASSMADAVMEEEPWFGYYWGPTVPLGKYDMTKVDLGEIDEEVHARNQNQDADNPGVSDFPAAPILTAVTSTFQEENPAVFELMQNMTFKTEDMSSVLAWMDENTASADEAAVYYLTNYQDQWSEWLSDEARENLASVLEEG